ncbi:hypothetical protein LNO81_12865 [Klebsiella variicola subsp. variicola]|nr:hypothetical protein [Klebsiella variicola subsp. variicola]
MSSRFMGSPPAAVASYYSRPALPLNAFSRVRWQSERDGTIKETIVGFGGETA